MIVMLSATRVPIVFPAVPSCRSVISTKRLRGACVPRELRKSVLPPYVIEPPDVLLIEAIHVVPKQPYHLQPFDTIAIQVMGTPPQKPRSQGICTIGADGTVYLGAALRHRLSVGQDRKRGKRPHCETSLGCPGQSGSLRQFGRQRRPAEDLGPHLVAMDGTVTLGSYGSVSVVGLTVDQARLAVQQLSLAVLR